jgi:hypothetical protein
MRSSLGFAAIAAGVVSASCGLAQASIIAAWTFPTPTPVAPNNFVVMPVSADINNRPGLAQITTDALSSPAVNVNGDVQYFAGSTVNAPAGFAAGAGLSLRGGTGNQSNGKSFTFRFDASNASNLSMSFAERYTTTGPTSVVATYSIDGTNFLPLSMWSTDGIRTGNFLAVARVLDLSAIPAVNNAPSVFVRMRFEGFSGSTGTVRLDNVVVVPTPGVAALAAMVGIGAVARRRR